MSKRIVRNIMLVFHLIAACYNMVAIYTPLHEWPPAFSMVQWVSFPLLVITGVMMVKGRFA